MKIRKLPLNLSILVVLCSVLFLWAFPNQQYEPIELKPIDQLKYFQYQMDGNWLPDVSPLHVGPKDYVTLQNLSSTSTGYETVSGYSKINTTLTDSPINLHHFSKDNESHVVAKVYYDNDDLSIVDTQSDAGENNGMWSDGSYIYVACQDADSNYNGILAYIFSKNRFVLVGHVEPSATFYARDVWSDGTYIYAVGGSDVIYAYTFQSGTFSLKASLSGITTARSVWGDGTYIYVARDGNGLSAYTFDGSSFTNVGNIDSGGVAWDVWGDGTYVYLANRDDGLRAYTFNGSSFTSVGNVDDGSFATGIWGDGTYLYLANGTTLRAYTFNGSSFTGTGSISAGNFAIGVSGDGSYIYLADNLSELGVYSYNGSAFTLVQNIDTGLGGGSYIYADGKKVYVSSSETGDGAIRAYSRLGYALVENTTPIPLTGEFETSYLYQLTDSGLGSFSNGPKGTMFYADGQETLVWGGDETPPLVVLVGDSLDEASNYTYKVTNDLTDELINFGSGGLDSYTVTLLHMNGTDGSTTFTDSSSSAHTFTANGDAQIDTALYNLGDASGLFDGTGDYLSATDSADFYFGSAPFTIDFWLYMVDGSNHGIFYQSTDANNYAAMWVSDSGATENIQFQIVSGGVTQLGLSIGGSLAGKWNHIALVYDGSEHRLRVNGGSGSSHTGAVSYPDFSGAFEIGRVLAGPASGSYLNGWVDEFRISKGIARWTTSFTPYTQEYNTSNGTYLYVMSQYKLDGVKFYIQNANQETSTLSGDVWTGSSFTSHSLTDNTSSGGKSLNRTGTVTWTYSEDPKVYLAGGSTAYIYRFSVSAGGAGIYKLSVSAPLQPVRDIWNGSPRTCISFQASRTSKFEDYTFLVEAKDSSKDSAYAATIGGLTSTNSDYFITVFDDRSMGVEFNMLSDLVNDANATISDVQYYNGSSYVSVGYFDDRTLDSTSLKSFSKSGVVFWNPPNVESEHPLEVFGVTGYAYKFIISGTLTDGTGHDGTSIDLVTGITAPLELKGYDKVGSFNGRMMLIKGNRVDFSQLKYPWVFNGIDASDPSPATDETFLSLYFGDGNDIVGTTNLFNRYGSKLVELWVVFKKNSMSILYGNQPYQQLPEPFTINEVSKNIGCAAPRTINSYQMEVADQLKMSIVVWLDFSGPYAYTGAEPSRLIGIENYFDPSNSESINYNHIDNSFGYIDSVNDQWNLLIPTGSSTVPNKWLVFDFRYKKWFEKVPPAYPAMSAHVQDVNGIRYNYGLLSTGQMLRLDNTQTWDGTPIAQTITTGYFSPLINDAEDFGFWTKSEIRAIRLISEKISEDADVTITLYADGVSAGTITVPLDPASGVLSKNSVAGGNIAAQADFFQIKYSTSTSTEKWRPLANGFQARRITED